jgi:two-component system, OmpR family, response regulator RegX3
MREGWILVIDDDDDLSAVLLEVLRSEGYRAGRATSLRDGWRAVDEDEPDLVLLDWRLPDGDPEELARLLNDRGVPFVLTSGADRTIENAERVGAAAVLEKPFNLDELLRVIERSLAGEGPRAYS